MREFHDGMYGRVSIGGDISNAFEINHGVKQGCVLAPTLFALYLAAVLDTMTIDLSRGFYIQLMSFFQIFFPFELSYCPLYVIF